MRGAFIHDHNFVFNDRDNKYYDGSGGAFNFKLWRRYLAIFDTLLVVGREKRQLPNKLVDATSINVDFYLINSLERPLNRFLKREKIKVELESALRDVDFAIIRIPSTLGYLAQEVCREHKIKYMLEVVGCAWDAYLSHSSLLGKVIAPVEYYKQRRAIKKSLHTIYVTQHFLQNRYPTNSISVGISNVNLDEVEDEETVRSFYKSYSVKKVLKIGMIGTFHVKYKGHEDAIRALNYIVFNKLVPNPKLCLVGTGNSKWIEDLAIKYEVSDYVEIVGTLDAGEKGILPFLDNVHIYIQPSKTEGLPRTIIEAMSRGRLVAGAKVGGIPELIPDKYLHKPGSWRELADIIVELYKKMLISCDEDIKRNLTKANDYVEKDLQQKRFNFIQQAISNDKTT